MALAYGWSPTTAGLVQSAFFYGFLAMQLPGGMLSNKLGGAYVLPRGLAVWSTATAALPAVAGDLTALCLTRAAMGMGEAVAPSSIIDMITRTVVSISLPGPVDAPPRVRPARAHLPCLPPTVPTQPAKERASAVSFAFSGLHLGSIVGLLASPAIIEWLGWPSLFYIFGAAGALWLALFQSIMDEVQVKDPELAACLLPNVARPDASSAPAPAQQQQLQQQGIPYRAFLRSRAVQVLCFTHFAHNWCSYTMLSWLPTYFTSTLGVDLMHAAQTALLPPLAGMVASAAAGTLADRALAAGVPLPVVRKAAQSVGFLAPTAFLALASQAPCTHEDSAFAIACITAALGLSSFSLAGLYCSHGDLSTKYSSALLGLTNVAGSLPGILGVAAVGALYEQTHDWSLSLFAPSALFLVAGTAAYVGFGSHEPVDFDRADNSELAAERAVKKWAGAARKAAGWVRRAVGGGAPSAAASAAEQQQQQQQQQCVAGGERR